MNGQEYLLTILEFSEVLSWKILSRVIFPRIFQNKKQGERK